MNDDNLITEYLETGDETTLAALSANDAADARAMRELLGSESVWEGPGEELLARIQLDVRATAQEPAPVESVAPIAPVIDMTAARKQRRALKPWISGAIGLAAGVALVLGIGVATRSNDGPSTQVALGATDLAPSVDGTASIRSTNSGFEVVLHISGLARAPHGSFYQAWLKGDRGLVPIGTFHSGGTITLWSGVDPADYPAISVTIEAEDGDPASSGQRVLTGTITP